MDTMNTYGTTPTYGAANKSAVKPTATEGDVTIKGSVEGRLRQITLRLGPETYSKAIQAHDDRSTVQCTGELVKEGRGYRLKDPRRFEIVVGDDVAG